MKKATVTISFDQEKLKAIQFYAGKAGTSLESDLDEFKMCIRDSHWLHHGGTG